jgi:hypothetical protein
VCRVFWNTLQPRFGIAEGNLPDVHTTEGYFIQSFIGITLKEYEEIIGRNAKCF